MAERRRKPRPTTATPGSKAKINIMRQRFEDNEELFHPDDASVPDVPERAHYEPSKSMRILKVVVPNEERGGQVVSFWFAWGGGRC